MDLNVFTTSDETTRPDWCDSTGSWRVAHADRMEALVGEVDPDAYVSYNENVKGRKALWVGVRDNADQVEHTRRVVVLSRILSRAGFWVIPQGHPSSDRVAGLLVVDRIKL